MPIQKRHVTGKEIISIAGSGADLTIKKLLGYFHNSEDADELSYGLSHFKHNIYLYSKREMKLDEDKSDEQGGKHDVFLLYLKSSPRCEELIGLWDKEHDLVIKASSRSKRLLIGAIEMVCVLIEELNLRNDVTLNVVKQALCKAVMSRMNGLMIHASSKNGRVVSLILRLLMALVSSGVAYAKEVLAKVTYHLRVCLWFVC